MQDTEVEDGRHCRPWALAGCPIQQTQADSSLLLQHVGPRVKSALPLATAFSCSLLASRWRYMFMFSTSGQRVDISRWSLSPEHIEVDSVRVQIQFSLNRWALQCLPVITCTQISCWIILDWPGWCVSSVIDRKWLLQLLIHQLWTRILRYFQYTATLTCNTNQASNSKLKLSSS